MDELASSLLHESTNLDGINYLLLLWAHHLFMVWVGSNHCPCEEDPLNRGVSTLAIKYRGRGCVQATKLTSS